MLRDFNMDWNEIVEYIPAQAFQTYVTGAGIAAGDPVFQEIAATGMSGIAIAAAGDMIATLWSPGNHVDVTKQIRFRVIYSQTSTTATDTVDWIVTYTPIVVGTTVLIAPATALSTAITLADASSGVAQVVQASSFGVIAKNTIPDTTAFLALNVEADGIGTYSANEINLLGLEVRYTKRRMVGVRRNLLGGRRILTTRPLGTLLASQQEGA